VGTVFYLFKADLRLTSKGALISLGLLLPMLFHEELAETALTILGGYLLFWCAFKAPVVRLGRLAGVDISYGVYLYAWPIQSLLITSYAHINPWMLCAASTVLAGGAGYLSWILVEKPAQRCVRSLRVPTLRFSRAVPQRRI
jgi:peptidoglycan/LPS O-acetylase OafA/YrhL